MADEDTHGGSWLLEPPQPGEFSITIRQGDEVELSEGVRAALEQLARAVEAADMGQEVSGFAELWWCQWDCATYCSNKKGQRGTGMPGSAAGSAGASGVTGLGGPARPQI